MNNYSITYYTLSDCTSTVTVTADSEAAAIEQTKLRDDFDVLVDVAQVAAQPEIKPVLIYERRQEFRRGQFCEHGTYLTLCPECSDLA